MNIQIESIINYLIELATSAGLKILAALVLLVVGLKGIKWLRKWIRTSEKLNKVDDSLRSFMISFSSVVLYIVLFITIAVILGIPTTSFITMLASCGVAIGLALQGSLSNFAGGIMILIFKPFKVGDYVEAAGESGTVTEISVVYTELLTVDNKRIIIPNGTITNSVIENYSAENIRRVDFTFNTAYDCDIDKVKKIIGEILESHPKALKNPEYFVRLSAHNDSALTYTARVWCKTEDYWDVNFDVMESVKKAFDANGIQIPYNQLDVHIDNK